MFFETEVEKIKTLEKKVLNLEKNLSRLEEKYDEAVQILRTHLVRLKNQEAMSDSFIFQGEKVADCSPREAFHILQNPLHRFIILDVSEKLENPIGPSLWIPYGELAHRIHELPSRFQPMMVISEDGTTSILACQKLIDQGFLYLNNISGGKKFWPSTTP